MIKSMNLKPFTNVEIFPTYVYKNGLTIYTLVGKVFDSYEITLGNLIIGEAVSNDELISHALFESYTAHGEKMSVTRARAGGYEREFNAAKNAMYKAGIEFNPIPPCHFSELMKGLGAWYQAVNPDIQTCTLVSQRCH